MSLNIGPKRSEKGLLTPDNCVATFIDHEPQMLFAVSNFDREGIINNVVALAKATRVFDIPVVLSTVEAKSFSGNIWPQLKAIFPNQTPIERTSMNSWDDKNFLRVFIEAHFSVGDLLNRDFHFDLPDGTLIHPRPFRLMQIDFVAALRGPSA